MADLQSVISHPDFAGLSPAAQKYALSQVNPSIGELSDEGVQHLINRVSVNITPPPAKAPLPTGLTTGSERRERLGLPAEEPSLLGTAAHIAASPVKALTSIPSQLGEFMSGSRPPSGGFLSEEPITEAASNLGAAFLPGTKLQSPVEVGPGKFIQPEPGMVSKVARKLTPTKLKPVFDLMQGGPEPVRPATTWERTSFRSPLVRDMSRVPLDVQPGISGAEAFPPHDPSSIPQMTEFPSGRIPGEAYPIQRYPERWLQEARDLRSAITDQPSSPPSPDLNIPPVQRTHSGRLPGPVTQRPATSRVPLYEQFGQMPNPPMAVAPQQVGTGEFPSGRVPGHLRPPATPAPATAVPTIESVPGAQPAPVTGSIQIPPVQGFDPVYSKALETEMGERVVDMQRKAVTIAKKLKELDTTPDATSTPESRAKVAKAAGYTRAFKDKSGDRMWSLVTHEYDNLR